MPESGVPAERRPSLRIRTAREADVAAIERFVPAAVDWATVISALGAVVATEDGLVQGVLVRWPHPTHVLLERLAVSPGARRGGIGTALLDVAEREAIEAGVNAVRSRTGGALEPFLRQRGYREVDAEGVLEKRLHP